jgi:hypothetical protein
MQRQGTLAGRIARVKLFGGEHLRDIRRFTLMIGVAGVILISLTLAVGIAYAQNNPPPEPGVANETCLGCHGAPDQTITLPSGEVLYLTVNEEEFNNSVHGSKGYACVQCHTDITGYPHPALQAKTLREMTVSMYRACGRCHEGMYEKTQDSVHAEALAGGNLNAAVCSDCHGAHNVHPFSEQPRSAIPQTCERCHSTIYDKYKDSVHGAALIGEGNPDVPSCIDCHGVHNVKGPVDAGFHLKSPEICAKCHTDKALMAKYGLNTDVLDTYLSDFHGTTVMFDAEIPGQQTNKPVCVDCHGVHDIAKTDDPNSTVIKENLLATCQKCHPDATENFSSAWLGHYVPSPTKYPIIYYVTLFYLIFIPTLLGGMALFVFSDAGRRLIDRRKEKKHE